MDIEFDRCILYQPGDGGYFTLRSKSKLNEEELEKVKEGVEKTVEAVLYVSASASRIMSDLYMMGYVFKPGYRWEDDTLEIYEDIKEEGKIMMDFNESYERYLNERKNKNKD
ncbi:MAG: hypothetical protein KAU95_02555 [Candidatus Aenigmarchaeota archaeon]|nr:hypothetical protein [Candidatus Aenigmarchaeota archaeon]